MGHSNMNDLQNSTIVKELKKKKLISLNKYFLANFEIYLDLGRLKEHIFELVKNIVIASKR